MATETRERITDPERLSRLEGAHEHMATKADLAALETRLMERAAASEIMTAEKIAESEIRLMEKIAESNEKTAETGRRIIMWGIGIAVSAVAAGAAIITLLQRLFGG